MAPLSLAEIAKFQRQIPGLDNKLEYIPCYAINDEYKTYKAADKAAGDASAT